MQHISEVPLNDFTTRRWALSLCKMNLLCEYATLNDESADDVHEVIRVPTDIERVTHTSKGACQNIVVSVSDTEFIIVGSRDIAATITM